MDGAGGTSVNWELWYMFTNIGVMFTNWPKLRTSLEKKSERGVVQTCLRWPHPVQAYRAGKSAYDGIETARSIGGAMRRYLFLKSI